MPAWGELLEEVNSQPDETKGDWVSSQLVAALEEVSKLRGDRNVIFYSSAFLQKPQIPQFKLQIMQEDLNGFMSSITGMDYRRGLTLLLHTPGGAINATETIVSYLRSKFKKIETIIPVFAMSAGTMIALGTDRIVMGRQSQLGPIDPQMIVGNNSVSARAIVEQFNRAHDEVSNNPILAHVWAPLLQSLGPALLTEAQNAIGYSEGMVAAWLKERMFKERPDCDTKSNSVARFFSDASKHLSHGRRIDREEARGQDVPVEDLEDNQELQEAVLTAYHLATIMFELSPGVKLIMTNGGRLWLKNHDG